MNYRDLDFFARKATDLISQLDKKLVRVKNEISYFKDPETYPEYICISRTIQNNQSGHVLWVDLQDGLSVLMITIYFEGLDIASIYNLIIKLLGIGGEAITKITLWDDFKEDMDFIQNIGHCWH